MNIENGSFGPNKLSAAKQQLLKKLLSASAAKHGERLTVSGTEAGHSPLSFAQQRLWFLQQLHPSSSFYTIIRAYRFTGPLRHDVLKKSLQELVCRHESFRTTFQLVGETDPVQVVADDMELSFTRMDLSGVAVEKRGAAIARLIREEFGRSFNLSIGPLARFTLARMDDQEHAFILCIHHIITDDWSLGFFFRELSAFYTALCSGQSVPQHRHGLRYFDFARSEQAFLNSREFQIQLDYWKRQLAESSPTLNLPAKPRPAIQNDLADVVSFLIDDGVMGKINALCRQERCTLFVFMLAVFEVLLARFTGNDDLCIGTIISTRDRKSLETVFGLITNTVVLRQKLDSASTFKQVLQRTRDILIEAHQNKDLPFEVIVRAAQADRSNAHAPLFQAIAFLQNTYQEQFVLPDIDVQPIQANNPVTAFDLSLGIERSAGGLKVALQYKTEVLEASTVERFLSDYESLIQWMLERPDSRISSISLLSARELEQLTAWNSTALDLSLQMCHRFFEQQVEVSPEAIAISCAECKLSYRDLNHKANQLARCLREAGVWPETLVGVCTERSPEAVLALLAVLKAGGAYVPLDPAYPLERLKFMTEDAHIKVLLTHKNSSAPFKIENAVTIQIDSDWDRIARHSIHDLDDLSIPEAAAYLIYTSGSTGIPKGVVVSQRALANQLLWLKSQFPLTCADRVLQRTSLSFDAAIGEIFLPLITGAQLIIADPGQSQSPDYLLGIMSDGITMADLPPPLLMALLQLPSIGNCSSLHTVMCGGEMLPPELRDRFLQTLSASLYNLYGPTETTIQSTFHRCQAGETRASVPIGRAISNTEVYVLDHSMALLPPRVAGELYIGGMGVARGYLNRPDLTADRFLPDPFSRETGSRIYRTGDRVRWTSEGELEYLGRTDHQVKLRGYRIETGEIEAALQSHSQVQQSVVMLREDQPGHKELVAYIVPCRDEPPEPEGLRFHLKKKLPEYMVPWHFVFLEQLPLSPSAKVDRRALPPPERNGKHYAAPRTAAEEILSGIFAEVLSLERVGLGDNFFALGGHSLMATRLVNRIRAAFGVELPLHVVFDAPTVAALVCHLHVDRNTRLPLAPQPRLALTPLSYAQQRLWFIDQMEQGSTEYNMPEALRLRGTLSRTALRHTIHAIIQRHESLRTHFALAGSEPVQVIAPSLQVELLERDLSEYGETEQAQLVEAALQREWEIPFDLSRGPLLRFRLLKLGEQDHILLRTFHHIISDGWSHGVFSREFMRLYDAYCEGRENPLSPLPVQYADFTLWQRQCLTEEVLVGHLEYWKKQLLGAPGLLALPLDHPRPPRQTFAARRLATVMPSECAAALRRLAQSHDATLYMTLLSAFAVLLHRYTGEQDIVIGSPIANRQEAALEHLIGFFVNSIVIRMQVAPKATFQQILAKVRAVTLEGYTHQDLPFERLVAELSPQRSLNITPVYQIAFALQNAPLEAQLLKGLVIEPVRSDELRVRFDLELHVLEHEHTLEFWWIYNRDLFDPWRIGQMANHYTQLLNRLVENATLPVGDVELVDNVQRSTLLDSFNSAAYSMVQATVVDMFIDHAARAPQATAVVCGSQRLSYGELERLAKALASQLSSRGLGPEARIGLCIHRSIEMVAGIMGILLSGAAYVPLDPESPPERLRHIINDSGLVLVITSRSQRAAIEQTGISTLLLDFDEWRQQSALAVSRIYSPLQLAYVIYTSGSSGKPKGVGVSHSNLSYSTQARWQTYQYRPESYLLLSSFAFDSSVAGLFWVLSQGGTLHIPEKGVHNDVHALAGLIEQNHITHLLCLPTFYDQILEEGGSHGLRSLQTVIVAGEVCTVELAEKHCSLLPHARIYNEYGPTEATVWSTVHSFQPGAGLYRVPIGKPIPNAKIYVLDSQMGLALLGVPGELCIGGSGVARGYVNHPELTAERFLPNPFDATPGARLYRTGDIARWRPDGELEFLGRNDQQVKIRGYRIELEEIEIELKGHARVQDAVVIVREQAGQSLLFAYIVPRLDEKEAARDQCLQIEQWKQLYESLYRQASGPADFNIVGWISSYTGLPLPAEEMQIWVEETAARLRTFHADHILEIGCGTGLLLTRLAGHCQSYLGTDFSSEALAQLRSYLAEQSGMGSVTLHCGLADDLSFVPDDSIDLVVLNSVVQYFPSLDYLLQVLSQAWRVTRKGGHIFVGDVRSLPLAQAYYASIQLHKASPQVTSGELQRQIAQSQEHENELLIDPELFAELAARQQKLGFAETVLKPGAYDNELSRFRYDVTLSVGEKKALAAPAQWVRWDATGKWDSAIRQHFLEHPDQSLGLSDIPDKRVAAAVKAARLLSDAESHSVNAEQLRAAIQVASGQDPAEVQRFALELGVKTIWRRFNADGIYDVIFNPQWQEVAARDDAPLSYYRRFANRPTQSTASAELGRELLDYLRQRLPEYMLPLAVMVLPSWPLTATGKIDKRALPSPEHRTQGYSAPGTPLEESLAEIWARALGLSRVGVDDNFFDLGGHSLLLPRIRFMVREALQRDIPVVDFFAFPTICSLAKELEGRHEPLSTADSELRASQQREFLRRQRPVSRRFEAHKEVAQ